MHTRSATDIEKATEKLLEDLKEVVRDGEELLKAGAEELGERGVAAKEKLMSAIEAAKETGRKLEERAVTCMKKTDKVVRENPYQSVGIAFGVGMLLGVILARK